MTETQQTKVCPLCAETIKAAAKVCPHCRRGQGRLVFVSRYDLLALLSILVFVLIVVFSWYFFGTSRKFSPERHKITVLSTQFGVERTSDHTNVVVSGILTNASDYTWKLTGFEIRFLDGAGKTVDAENAGSEYMDLTILSHAECSFRLSLPFRESIPEHTSSRVRVTKAEQPGFWFASEAGE
jgi:hypothetical protein